MTTSRSRKYENPLGYFEYTTVSNAYYPIGIRLQNVENKYVFLMATPEKALCDLITATPQLRIQSLKALRIYLEDDLRFEMSILKKMDGDIIRQCIDTGKKKDVLKLLLKLFQS